MARRTTDRAYSAEDLSRASMWTPAAPDFLDKREEREAARQERRFSAVQPSYTQTRVAMRRAYALESAQVSSRYAQDAFVNERAALAPEDRYGIASAYEAPASAPVRPARARRAQRRPEPSWYSDSSPIYDFDELRSGADSIEDDYGFADEEAPARPTMAERFAGLRHALRHRRAERSFDRNFEDAPSRSQAADNAPRAAVYEGRMGRSHQKASRMQAKGRKGGFALPSLPSLGLVDRLVHHSRFATATLVVLCLVFSVVMVYPSAQDCYLQIRAKDQAAAEYEAIAARNAEIEERVAALQTDEGMENLVHSKLGWVREGENAVSVSYDGRSGVDPAVADQTSAIAPGSVPAPTTWYSPMLDLVFGYPSDRA